ncbi:MAG: CspA family cold shock protein [Motiliproteus sp.]|jgi:CspA family cold shock protein
MKSKTMLLGVLFSAGAAVVAAYLLQPENFPAAAATVFVACLFSSLLTVASATVSASPSSSSIPNGVEVVSANDANDHREGGIVKWFNVTKGFGFITRDQGDDVFVHFRSIRGSGHRSLNEGQRVKFEVIESEKGLQAEDVSVVA